MHAIPYIFVTRAGPTEVQQMNALSKGLGIKFDKEMPIVFVDKGPDANKRIERAKAIASMRPGDGLAVASPTRLLSGGEDPFVLLEAIAEKQGHIIDARSGLTYQVTEGAINFLRFFEEVKSGGKYERAKRGAAAARRKGKLTGRPKKKTEVEIAAIKSEWQELNDYGEPLYSELAICEKHNVSASWCRRNLGSRYGNEEQ